MSIKPVSGLHSNHPKNVSEINEKLKNNKDLSNDEKKILIDKKKKLTQEELKQKKESHENELAMKNANYKLQKQKKEFKNANHGYTSLIKKFTFNKTNDHITRMMNGATSSVYASRLAHLISKGWGESEVPLTEIGNNIFLYSTNKIYTRNSVKMPLAIIDWGDVLPVGWLDDIRQDLTSLENTFNIQQNVKNRLHVTLNHISHNSPSALSFFDNKRLQNDFKRIANTMITNNVNDPSINNYIWLQDLEAENVDSLWDSREFLELIVSNGKSGETAELLHDAYDLLIKRLKVLGMKTKDMYLLVQNYYDEFSPIGHRHEKGKDSNIHHKYIPIVRSGEMITSASQLQQGNISDREGVPIGIDVNSEKPILVNYADNNLPPSTIIAGTTGSGKTYLIQSMLIGFLVDTMTYFPIVIDFKSEYVELGKAAGMQIISSSPSDGIYYDTMEFNEVTGDNNVDQRALDNAISTTDNVFEILLGSEWKRLKHAFEYTRRSLYHRQGVSFEKPETWKNSKGLTYHTFYNEITYILSHNRIQAEEEIDLNDLIELKQILSTYFEIDGSKANYFRNPIRMKDINESKGVIFALDQSSVNTVGNGVDTKLALTMQFILHILNNLTDRKKDKRIIPIFWEETNQLLLIPKVAKMISSLTTGGRSRGIRNFFITNSPSQIFNAEQESKFSEIDPGLISTIMNNVLSIIVGKNSKYEIKSISDRYNLNNKTIQIYLDLLSKESTQDNDDSNALSHKFIIRHRGHTALMQAISNPVLDKLGIFGTEVKLDTRNTIQKQREELMKELMKNKDVTSENIQNNLIIKDKNSIQELVSKEHKQNDNQ